MEHPDVKTHLCRIRLLGYHIQSRQMSIDESFRAKHFNANNRQFMDSRHKQRVELAQNAVKDAETILSNVQSSLQMLIQQLVSERVRRDPEYHPISLIDKFTSVASLQRQRKPFRKPRERQPRPFDDIREIIESKHGPTPTSDRLVYELYHSLKTPITR